WVPRLDRVRDPPRGQRVVQLLGPVSAVLPLRPGAKRGPQVRRYPASGVGDADITGELPRRPAVERPVGPSLGFLVRGALPGLADPPRIGPRHPRTRPSRSSSMSPGRAQYSPAAYAPPSTDRISTTSGNCVRLGVLALAMRAAYPAWMSLGRSG